MKVMVISTNRKRTMAEVAVEFNGNSYTRHVRIDPNRSFSIVIRDKETGKQIATATGKV